MKHEIWMPRAVEGNGLATTLASLVGALANTTYDENTGVFALTQVFDPGSSGSRRSSRFCFRSTRRGVGKSRGAKVQDYGSRYRRIWVECLSDGTGF